MQAKDIERDKNQPSCPETDQACRTRRIEQRLSLLRRGDHGLLAHPEVRWPPDRQGQIAGQGYRGEHRDEHQPMTPDPRPARDQARRHEQQGGDECLSHERGSNGFADRPALRRTNRHERLPCNIHDVYYSSCIFKR
jgi:hypothetical protein